MRARHWILLALLLTVGGCENPFRPASPERPTQGVSVLENYSEPDSVLATITRAMAAKSDGALAYENAMSAGFLATHAPEVVTRAEQNGVTVPSQWGLTLEVNNLFPTLTGLRPEGYAMTFWRDNTLLPDDDNRGSGQVLYRRYYEVFTLDELEEPADTIAIGLAELTLQADGTRWRLARWDDTYIPAIGVNPADNTDLQSMGARRLSSLARPSLVHRPPGIATRAPGNSR